jgi:hypothetical protein
MFSDSNVRNMSVGHILSVKNCYTVPFCNVKVDKVVTLSLFINFLVTV